MLGVVLLRLALALPVLAATDSTFDSLLSRIAGESGIPGIAVGVVSDGKVELTRAFGDVDENSLFQIASCTKTFIAIGIAHFVDAGHVNWETPVVNVLPKLVTNDTYLTENVNIGDLLAHNSGYGDHDGDLAWMFGDIATERELVFKRLRSLPVRKQLRLTFMYSNIGYEIATMVLEALAGEPWYRYVERSIWEPLGMTSTYASLNVLPVAARRNLSLGHMHVISADPSDAVGTYDLLSASTPSLVALENGIFGAGSVVSTVGDFCKFVAHLLAVADNATAAIARAESAHVLVSQRWAQAFLAQPVAEVGNSLGAGFGFDVVGSLYKQGERFFTKGGDSLFHSARTGYLPDRHLGAVVLVNMQGALAQGPYVNGLRNALLDHYSGKKLSEVEVAWEALERDARAVKQVARELPVQTFSVPLQGSQHVNITVKCQENASLTDAGCFYPKRVLEKLVAAVDVAGLPPAQRRCSLVGSFSDDYYGSLHVASTRFGTLRLEYGKVNCTLFEFALAGESSYLCVLNAVLGPQRVVFDDTCNEVAFPAVGMAFTRSNTTRQQHLLATSSRRSMHDDSDMAPKQLPVRAQLSPSSPFLPVYVGQPHRLVGGIDHLAATARSTTDNQMWI
eukprot:TRINITY_DN124422_c0_g1_i1.p1 TRINITY_DN124422_c0_g1~~TRINITY_DN124422_c0_g1_i1.p1  ORF type:complete len:622 (-),score=75.50 TRINITY_DN124422_c0_g1_i1:217-2082(-)